MKLQPPPDLASMTVSADFWQTSMNETEAWEEMREGCLHDEAVRLVQQKARESQQRHE